LKKNDIYQYLNLYKDLFGDNIYLKSDTNFKNIVEVSGNSKSGIVFISEYKNKEDLRNPEMIQLLDKMLSSINLSRQDVCIFNILLPDNKTSTRLEFDKYKIDIKMRLMNIKPNLIVALGIISLISIFNVEKKIMSMRQQIFNYNEVDFLVTYNPKDLLGNLDLKKYAWEDFKLIRDKYINA
tara:strand:- start:297 stop:842 length:546 start_codon:yes stop_codon:yes gene_type:complete